MVLGLSPEEHQILHVAHLIWLHDLFPVITFCLLSSAYVLCSSFYEGRFTKAWYQLLFNKLISMHFTYIFV